jgi:hypothetical protein
MSDLSKVYVRRLDGRKTPVNLEELEYFDRPVVQVHDGDPWVAMSVQTDRIYIHPDFRFLAEITHVQYRGARTGDTFVHPLAGQPVVHVRASEIPDDESAGLSPPPPPPLSGTDQQTDKIAGEPEDTNTRIAEFLRRNPKAKSPEIGRAVGLTASGVRQTDAWAEHQAAKPERTPKRSVRAMQLTNEITAMRDSGASDPATIAEENEEREMSARADIDVVESDDLLRRRYLEGAEPHHRARFYEMNPTGQKHELESFRLTGERCD